MMNVVLNLSSAMQESIATIKLNDVKRKFILYIMLKSFLDEEFSYPFFFPTSIISSRVDQNFLILPNRSIR